MVHSVCVTKTNSLHDFSKPVSRQNAIRRRPPEWSGYRAHIRHLRTRYEASDFACDRLSPTQFQRLRLVTVLGVTFAHGNVRLC
jgi:hypothetical protein